ncbi:hypothetical protein Vadar_022744 [Vaccinium darrowii]|uniref:Uncharacterized protein n=1 Tax=Vaccinium darrowii TaxID=229202 RepID=A0ACB7ZLV6_9ERIC|nr:hypothetical protein Vadar_022744 [Vaccinium darrowii]
MAGILMVAAETGNINGLYASIKADPKVLDDIDAIPFVDTPLHTAASAGHTDFAIEILRLKPSFGRKLNPDGLSSLHLALINDKFETVKRLIKFDKELIRIKGREGANPLHYIAEKASDGDQKRMDDPINADQQQRGTDEQQRALPNIEQVRVAAKQGVVDDRINILAEFLFACPNSVEDLTIQDETALHIAVKSKNKKAVAIILGCIRRIGRKRVLDYKDKEGNTVLHMAVSTSQDVIARSLCSAGALKSSSPDPSLAEFLNSPDRFSEVLFKLRFLLRRSVSIEFRNIGLVVAAVIATATFQAVLSPPGGVGDPSDNNLLTNGSNINATVSSTTNNLFAANTSFINATLFVPSDDPGKRLLFKDANPGLVARYYSLALQKE